MTDYVAHRRLALVFSPGVPLLLAGVVLHASGSPRAAWPLLILGTVATALFFGNASEFFNFRRWRRLRCPACGSPFRVDSYDDVTMTDTFVLFDNDVCRHTTCYSLACHTCGSKSRFDDAGRLVGPPPDDEHTR